MIKSKKELMLISFLGFLSSAVSYIFTILMLMSFAETPLEKILYFLCGVINDGVKWFSLITLIKYYRAKLYKNFIGYCVLFILFFAMSLTASISFSVFTVQKQMYTTIITPNDNYTNLQVALNKNKSDLEKLELEKTNELQRINKELDSLPLDHITRREQLATKKIDLTIFYDLKIDDLKLAVNKTTTDLGNVKTKETVNKTLKDNAIASFFSTMARVTHINIDNVILSFAIALGVILDVASIALTFDSSFSYQNKRSFNKDITNYKNIRIMKKTIDSQMDEGHYKIINFNDFIKYANANDLNISEINYSDVKDLVSRSSFYKFVSKYKETLNEVV